MSGTGSGDELAILVASFVEEVKPFFAGIRRGVAGIFALPRDGQAIGAARDSLATLAGSAKVLDLPAARQLAELAQLLGEAFEAAERGGVPDESQAPMLAMVDHLEDQLDGLQTGDERGRERLDNAYRLLDQVLQTVEQAEAAPPPTLEIALDDLLLTLQPAAPVAPEPEPVAAEPPAPAPAPEPTQTEIVLLAEDEVAPIEWGEKEAILWQKGGWDESQAAYGNTEWIFLDDEEVTTVGPVAAATDQVIERGATAPLVAAETGALDGPGARDLVIEEANLPAEAAVVAAAAESGAGAATGALATTGEPRDELVAERLPEGVGATGELGDAALAEETPAETGATGDLGAALVAEAAPAPTGGTGELPPVALDAEALEEAALLALSPGDLEIYLGLGSDEQQDFLRARLGEMADYATDLGIAVDREAVAGRDTGDLSALLQSPVSDTGRLPTDLPAATTDALIAPVAIARPKRTRRGRRLDGVPTIPEGTDRLLAAEGSAPADSMGHADDAPTPSAPGAEHDTLLQVTVAEAEATAAPDAGDDEARDDAVAAVDDLLLTEYRPADHGTGSLGTGTLRTDNLGTGDLSQALATAGLADEDLAGDKGGFLDALLEDEPRPAGDGHHLVAAAGNLFADDDDPDPNFAALPEVAPEIEAAFAQLSEADLNTFLTLDGDAALAFLHSRVAGAGAESVAPESTPVADAPALDGQVAAHDGGEPVGLADEDAAGANFGLDQEILEVFLQEAQELLVEWRKVAADLRRAPADAAVMADLRRVAHTLKGAANMMGFSVLGAAGWRVEHLLDLLDERGLTVEGPVLDFIDRTYALVERMGADATADPRAFAGESAALEAAHQALAEEIAAGKLGTALPTGDEDRVVPPSAGPREEPLAFDAGDGDGAVDTELLEIFVQEAEEHLGAFNRALVALDRNPADKGQLNEAKRVVHTLKGASAALGYPVTAALCHSIEDLFGALDDSGREPSREMLTLFFESAETLEALVAGITAGRGEDAARADALRARYSTFLGAGGEAQVAGGAAQGAGGPDRTPLEAAQEEWTRAAENAPRSVRVDIAHLDNLLNLVGELVINRTSQEQHLERLGRTVAELLLSVERLRRVGFNLESRYEVAELLRGEGSRAAGPAAGRGHLTLVSPPGGPAREDEFDALEMDRYTELHRISRELVEIAADINAAGNELDGLYDAFDQTLSRQGRIATDLQDRMMEVRLVPLSTLAARLYRAVRGVATRRGRPTELLIEGEAVEIDKVLLEEITDPLLHLVRNADDHGIESPEERRRRGKPATGTVRLSAAREGNEAVIRVQDDGAGIDLDRVLDKALARGIIRRRDGLTREQILDLIFLPGFSTSPTVSDISGRGVGLDVVRTNVTRLKGTIDVESELGVGTTFTIRLPIMLAVTRALLVRAGAQTFAIPLPVVEQVAFFRKELVSTVGGNELFDLGGEAYPVLHLARALGLPAGAEAPGARALIVGNADRRIALVVDELVGQQEVVVKRLGRHLQSVAGVAGATILGSGQVVLILNVLDLIGARRTVRSGTPAVVAPQPLRPEGHARPAEGARVAMVVDDSLSVRRVLTRTLERDGWQVIGAKDGVEALEMLAWARPQVMVLDIEMPRMDGYELTGLIRNGTEHQALPIVMLTSRAGEKHRRKAFDLGVSAYLVKPFEETELLRTVRELAGAVRRTVG